MTRKTFESFIEARNNYDNDRDEARGRKSKLFPVLAIAIVNGKVSAVLECTCVSAAQKAWGIEKVRKVNN